jgi:hypothetical protein
LDGSEVCARIDLATLTFRNPRRLVRDLPIVQTQERLAVCVVCTTDVNALAAFTGLGSGTIDVCLTGDHAAANVVLDPALGKPLIRGASRRAAQDTLVIAAASDELAFAAAVVACLEESALRVTLAGRDAASLQTLIFIVVLVQGVVAVFVLFALDTLALVTHVQGTDALGVVLAAGVFNAQLVHAYVGTDVLAVLVAAQWVAGIVRGIVAVACSHAAGVHGGAVAVFEAI